MGNQNVSAKKTLHKTIGRCVVLLFEAALPFEPETRCMHSVAAEVLTADSCPQETTRRFPEWSGRGPLAAGWASPCPGFELGVCMLHCVRCIWAVLPSSSLAVHIPVPGGERTQFSGARSVPQPSPLRRL